MTKKFIYYTQRSFPTLFYLLVGRFLDKKDQIDFWEIVCQKRLLKDSYEKPLIVHIQDFILLFMSNKGVRISNEEARELMTTNGLALPLEKYPGAHNRWKCECLRCGEIIYPRLAKVNSGQSACKSCGIAAFAKKRMLSDSEAREKMSSLGVIPDKDSPYPGALKPWRSTCAKCKYRIFPRYANVLNAKNPCVYCAKRKKSQEETIKALLASNLQLLDSNKKLDTSVFECRCLSCGNDVIVWWSTVLRGGNPCRYCSKTAILPEDAEKIMLIAGLCPLIAYPGASTPWESQCNICEKFVAPTLSSVKNGAGCGYCSGNRIDEVDVLKAFTNISLQPLEPYTNASTPWKSQCKKCGNVVSPWPRRVMTGSGCKFCMRVAVNPEKAFETMLKKKVQPLEPYSGSHTPWSCKCLTCGKTSSPTYNKVARRETGCRYCAMRGPDLLAPSYLYLIESLELNAYKIGVARGTSSRIKQHTSAGWTLMKSSYFSTGDVAYRAESEVLRWWRKDLRLEPFLNRKQMPHGGWTETIRKDALDIEEISEFMDDLVTLHYDAVDVPVEELNDA